MRAAAPEAGTRRVPRWQDRRPPQKLVPRSQPRTPSVPTPRLTGSARRGEGRGRATHSRTSVRGRVLLVIARATITRRLGRRRGPRGGGRVPNWSRRRTRVMAKRNVSGGNGGGSTPSRGADLDLSTRGNATRRRSGTGRQQGTRNRTSRPGRRNRGRLTRRHPPASHASRNRRRVALSGPSPCWGGVRAAHEDHRGGGSGGSTVGAQRRP